MPSVSSAAIPSPQVIATYSRCIARFPLARQAAVSFVVDSSIVAPTALS
jgi:hypothetical protein